MAKFSKKDLNLDGYKQAVEDLLIKTGLKIEQYAKESAPVDTGNYRSEISYDGGNEVIASANYSAAIEYGIQHEYDIRPVTAKALHFKDGGQEVFAKRVHHPTTKPQPVMRNAAAQTQKEIPQIWADCKRANNV